jgi:hypothetical protein
MTPDPLNTPALSVSSMAVKIQTKQKGNLTRYFVSIAWQNDSGFSFLSKGTMNPGNDLIQ